MRQRKNRCANRNHRICNTCAKSLLISLPLLMWGNTALPSTPDLPPLPSLYSLSPEKNGETIREGLSILPPIALTPGLWTEQVHPLSLQMTTFLSRAGSGAAFSKIGLTRNDYLQLMEDQVRCFMTGQLPNGMIKDPAGSSTYATGGYALAAAVLVSSGHTRDEAVLQSAIRAMDYSLDWMLESVALLGDSPENRPRKPVTMTDFFSQPVMMALEQFEKVAPADKLTEWKEKLKEFRPSGYSLYGSTYNNWPIVHSGGEYLRALHGFTDMAYVEWVLETQKHHFTPFGMFNESGAPFAYDGFSRYFLTCMLHRGYHGQNYDFYRDMCWRGAWTALFYQSPFGELPAGFRSAHHIWNEAELAVVFEIYAAHYAKLGRMTEAGAFKRGAHLALQSMRRWVRPDGSAYIVKNRFPVVGQPKAANPHSTYSLLAAGMMAVAYLYADDSIPEVISPADAGGFAFHIPGFNMVIANASGSYCEYMTRGNHMYNPTGLIRLHVRGGNPQLGPSDGVVEENGEGGIRSLGVGPAWRTADGKEIRIAEFPSTQKFRPHESRPGEKPQAEITIGGITETKVSFTASYDWNGEQVVEHIVVDGNGITVTDQWKSPSKGSLRIYYPMLVFDGLEHTDIRHDGASLTLLLREGGVRFEMLSPSRARIVRSGERMINFNGEIEPVHVDVKGNKAVYRISGTGVN